MTLVNGKATLDGLVTVDAVWDDTERWNGFLCPRMDKESADKVMSTLVNDPYAEPDRLSYAWDDETLVVSDKYGMEEDEVQVDRYDPDGDGLYALGAHGWIWTQED